MRRAFGLGVAVVLLAAPRRSSAQPPLVSPHPLVSLDVDPCVDVGRAEVRRIVGIELGALLVDAGTTANTDTTRVTATCKDVLVELRVDDPLTGKVLTRVIDLSRTASPAQSRLLAIAMAELVSASWTELEANPQPEAPPAGLAPSAGARDAATQVVRARIFRPAPPPPPPPLPPLRLSFMAAFEARGFLPDTGPTLGGGLRAVGLLSHSLGWSLDAIGAHASRSLALGDVAIDTVSLGASAFVHHAWERSSLRGGPGLRLGVARVTGESSASSVQAGSISGPWGGPMLAGALSFDPWSGITVELNAEAGYGLLSVRGRVAGIREVEVAGPSLAGGVAVGLFR